MYNVSEKAFPCLIWKASTNIYFKKKIFFSFLFPLEHLKTVLWIRIILIWIRICGSVSEKSGSGSTTLVKKKDSLRANKWPVGKWAAERFGECPELDGGSRRRGAPQTLSGLYPQPWICQTISYYIGMIFKGEEGVGGGGEGHPRHFQDYIPNLEYVKLYRII